METSAPTSAPTLAPEVERAENASRGVAVGAPVIDCKGAGRAHPREVHAHRSRDLPRAAALA